MALRHQPGHHIDGILLQLRRVPLRSCCHEVSSFPETNPPETPGRIIQPGLEPRRVRDLATLEFLTGAGNIDILGPPGVGKTHIAIGLAVAACQAGKSIYFTTLDDLVRKLKAADAANRLPRQLANLMRPSLLVIDEVGYLALDRDEANMFFQLISRRYEKGSTIITSNKHFTEWGTVLGDDVLATAILDRLLHHCDVLAINGPSYRLKDRQGLVTPVEAPAS
ncbi:IS21-like element helper ATPase IstB [Rhodococcus sp. BGS-1C]|uniref:IS21-like element helper ATPase IstB n=1 Tax=Rhodococcus sp. BGS-1C TaxID=2100132 RepID=UPI003DA0A6F6